MPASSPRTRGPGILEKLKVAVDRKYTAASGVALMSVAALTIPLVDGIAKYLSAAHSPLYISWMRYAVACAVVLPLAMARYGKSFLPREQVGAHLLRTIFLVAAMTCYFLAIAHIPLATAISAYFVGPIIALALAVVLLREALTVRKIVSLVLGFAGALVILRPAGSIDPSLLLALGSGAFFAFYMIATRQASRESDPIKTLAFQCLFGAVLLLPQAIWTWSIPAVGELWLLVAMGALSAGSHLLSITAFRFAQASTLAPLIYLELLGSVAIGYLAFGDVPDLSVWVGALTIVGAGLILLEWAPPPPRRLITL
jgi:drug/metabolite transporter (DMT)-like permease